MKIYIVTAGEYSDYSIYACFSSKELAEKYVEWLENSIIEEWDLDSPEEMSKGCYCVKIDTKGNVIRNEKVCENIKKPHKGSIIRQSPYGLIDVIIGCGKTEEHARRSAEDLRREILAFEGK